MTRKKKKKGAGLFSAVSEDLERAARQMHESLMGAKIPHALIGGIAVGAYARPRATADVDFIVPASAREKLSGALLRGHMTGVSMDVGGATVDLMFAKDDEEFVEAAIPRATMIEGLPVLGVEPLVYLKLAIARRRDINDVIDIVRAGLDTDKAAAFLKRHADDLVEDFEQLIVEAELE